MGRRGASEEVVVMGMEETWLWRGTVWWMEHGRQSRLTCGTRQYRYWYLVVVVNTQPPKQPTNTTHQRCRCVAWRRQALVRARR